MKIFVDSSLLIYLNASKSPALRKIYEDFYISLFSDYKAYSDVIVLDELIYISKKKYNIPYEVTLEFTDSIVLPYVEILPLGEKEYEKASEILKTYNAKPSDALHVAAMNVNNVLMIASEDRDFEKIEGLKRVWLA